MTQRFNIYISKKGTNKKEKTKLKIYELNYFWLKIDQLLYCNFS